MQNRYVGDVGDFGKYGLLRALCAHTGHIGGALSLGIVWYLVPDEEFTNGGAHTEYLQRSERNLTDFRACDPELYDELGAIVSTGKRNVRSIQGSKVLPKGTAFYGAPLSFRKGSPIQERRTCRSRWLAGAMESTARYDMVFVDPDNGLEVSVEHYARRGPKYVFFEELRPYCERQQSLVIYHHVGRRGSTEEQVQERLRQIRGRLGRDAVALIYHRGTARAFFVVLAQPHREILLERIKHFGQGPWGAHFELRTNNS